MDVSSLGFSFQGTLKHFLRGNVFAAVKLYHAAIVQRIGIPRQNAFCSHSRIGNSEISTSTCCYFGNFSVFFKQHTKLVAGFAEVTAREFFMRALKSFQGSRLINGWLTWWRGCDRNGTLRANGRQLLSLFDA